MDSGRLGTADIARLLGVSRPRVWQLRQQPGFPKPAGEEGGREYWYESTILRWAAGAGRTMARRAPLLYRPAASEHAARYEGSTVIAGYMVLSWDSSLGRVCLLYPPPGHAWTPAERLVELVPGAAVAVMVRFDYDPWGPNLEAVDLDAPERRYKPRWTDLARILGAPAPWWPFELRKPDEMLRWAPGHPPVVTQAVPDPDTGPLVQQAFEESDISTKTTLQHLARTIQQRATESAVAAIDLIDTLADREAIALAATPAPTLPPDDEEPPEHVRRDGWTQILRRGDTMAARCVAIALAWDGGRDLPFATLTEIHPALDPLAAEWVQTLVPTKRTAEFALFDERGTVRTLRDPATDLPATEDDEGVIRAAVPQFLPALTPLAEVILGEEEVVWIRTQDRRLYIAPEQPGAGVSWGYTGSGPHTLAELLDRLLDDINAPAPAINSGRRVPAGLLAGTTGGWETGAVLTRAELLAARDRR